jgi:helicase MOV-10
LNIPELALFNDSIADQDIGVITPYHAQCRKIRMVLKAFADGVKVGSVEEFQGQVLRFAD